MSGKSSESLSEGSSSGTPSASNTREVKVVGVTAQVHFYSTESSGWKDQGFARVCIFHNPAKGTYRVVAREGKNPKNVLINSYIFSAMVFREDGGNFIQWADRTYLYGLKFPAKLDCSKFAEEMGKAVTALKAKSDKKKSDGSASPTSLSPPNSTPNSPKERTEIPSSKPPPTMEEGIETKLGAESSETTGKPNSAREQNGVEQPRKNSGESPVDDYRAPLKPRVHQPGSGAVKSTDSTKSQRSSISKAAALFGGMKETPPKEPTHGKETASQDTGKVKQKTPHTQEKERTIKEEPADNRRKSGEQNGENKAFTIEDLVDRIKEETKKKEEEERMAGLGSSSEKLESPKREDKIQDSELKESGTVAEASSTNIEQKPSVEIEAKPIVEKKEEAANKEKEEEPETKPSSAQPQNEAKQGEPSSEETTSEPRTSTEIPEVKPKLSDGAKSPPQEAVAKSPPQEAVAGTLENTAIANSSPPSPSSASVPDKKKKLSKFEKKEKKKQEKESKREKIISGYASDGTRIDSDPESSYGYSSDYTSRSKAGALISPRKKAKQDREEREKERKREKEKRKEEREKRKKKPILGITFQRKTKSRRSTGADAEGEMEVVSDNESASPRDSGGNRPESPISSVTISPRLRERAPMSPELHQFLMAVDSAIRKEGENPLSISESFNIADNPLIQQICSDGAIKHGLQVGANKYNETESNKLAFGATEQAFEAMKMMLAMEREKTASLQQKLNEQSTALIALQNEMNRLLKTDESKESTGEDEEGSKENTKLVASLRAAIALQAKTITALQQENADLRAGKTDVAMTEIPLIRIASPGTESSSAARKADVLKELDTQLQTPNIVKRRRIQLPEDLKIMDSDLIETTANAIIKRRKQVPLNNQEESAPYSSSKYAPK